MASPCWKDWTPLSFKEARTGQRIKSRLIVSRHETVSPLAPVQLVNVQVLPEPVLPVVPMNEQVLPEPVLPVVPMNVQVLPEPVLPVVPMNVQVLPEPIVHVQVLPEPVPPSIVVQDEPATFCKDAPGNMVADEGFISDWDLFHVYKDDPDDTLRLGINVEEDYESIDLRTIKCDRENGVVTYFLQGFKVLSADGFQLQNAFPIKLKWIDGKLYGVISSAFAVYPPFSSEVKLLVPKAFTDEQQTAEALSILLFHVLRDKFRNHKEHSQLVSSEFVEVSPTLIQSYKNTQFTQCVKMYAHILFDKFLQLAK